MILSNSTLMAFVATTDSNRAKDFYTRILGLRLVADEDFALVLDAQGTMLRVQKVASFQPHPFTALGWQVDDIDTAVTALNAQGIAMLRVPGLPQDEVGIWTAGDQTRIAWFHDPDGNLLSLTEFPRKAATE